MKVIDEEIRKRIINALFFALVGDTIEKQIELISWFANSETLEEIIDLCTEYVNQVSTQCQE